MPIYKPTELRLFLEQLGISPKKSLSQNFLIDGNILRKIIASSQVTPGETVIEIGSGPGALTQLLLESGVKVIAIEKDRQLAHALERFQTPDNRLEIHCQDVLEFPFDQLQEKNLKVIANLPYHLTTPIIVHLLSYKNRFSSLTLMVQEEVARRFSANPGCKEYGSFTIFLNFYTKPSYAFTVSRQCFYPVPKVDSAVVILNLKEPPKIEREDKFFEITRTSFEHRRKMLKASLKYLYKPELVTQALETLKLNPLSRPEDLSLDNFLDLYKILTKESS